MEKIGRKIRIDRKKMGLSLEKLAQKLGISLMILQGIETGKSGPLVVILTEITNYLNKSILSFLEEPVAKKLPSHIKRENQFCISSSVLKTKVIELRKMIADNIVVTAGELGRRKSLDLHTNSGKEFTYIIQG